MSLMYTVNIGTGVQVAKTGKDDTVSAIRSLVGSASLQGNVIAIGGSATGARVVTVTGPQLATDSTLLLNGTLTLTLLSAILKTQNLVIKNISATLTATLACFGLQTIDGATTHTLLPGEVVTLMPYNGNYLIIGK